MSFTLVSCDWKPSLQVSTAVVTPGLIETIANSLTQTAEATLTSPALDSKPSLDPAAVVTLSPTVQTTFIPSATPTPPGPCNSAAAGRPIDVTIPDDTVIPAGSSFTKVWRLINTGTCPWTTDFAVVWFSGDKLGPVVAQSLSHRVESGQSIDIAVDLTAPEDTGLKQSYWKLRNAEAKLFGIGPASNAPFWVKIIVEETTTAIPTALPEPTPTPTLLVQGAVDLSSGESIDLDTGEKVPAGQGDFHLETISSRFVLQPESNAILGIAGNSIPSQGDCQSVDQGSDAVVIADLPLGTYFCYHTKHGLPGIARLADLNAAGIRLDFNTWAIP
ncbi:MAG TPA: NBR1-Ig-like domain-containing protein [Longilinea sp.]|nr:NBR1-Ig-like domain-containing protein [Longilinea sp.]